MARPAAPCAAPRGRGGCADPPPYLFRTAATAPRGPKHARGRGELPGGPSLDAVGASPPALRAPSEGEQLRRRPWQDTEGQGSGRRGTGMDSRGTFRICMTAPNAAEAGKVTFRAEHAGKAPILRRRRLKTCLLSAKEGSGGLNSARRGPFGPFGNARVKSPVSTAFRET
jgi:hypothetical protein